VGYTWEAERNYGKATEAFQAALAGVGASDFLYETLTLDLARVQELGGRRDEAVETYRRLLRDVPGTRRAEDVKIRLATLGAAPK
jgi:tetratricopeptide (TPR) repeat protein